MLVYCFLTITVIVNEILTILLRTLLSLLVQFYVGWSVHTHKTDLVQNKQTYFSFNLW